ncbi:endonuclease NucS [Microbacterium sp.]|uniref:endonuclease NucS n=1 Tax=Microbacterium sp. TaxID=51671 RepID=UPI0039E2DD02
MRLVIARCSVDYTGRLNAHLPLATRLLVHKGDGSLLVHSDGGSYKPLNWMSPPCTLTVETPDEESASAGVLEHWRVTHAKTGDALLVRIYEVLHDSSHDLGIDPGLQKDGVEADLQRLLAEQVEVIGDGLTLVRREYPTAIGPVDLLLRNPEAAVTVELASADGAAAAHVAVEVKRRAGIDAVEQLTRYLELLNRDSHLRPVRGVLAAQAFAPQARTLATDRGIACVVLDYEAMKGTDSGLPTLF